MAIKLYTKPAPPPIESMEPTEWPESLRQVLSQLFADGKETPMGPFSIEKGDLQTVSTLRALSVGGTQAIATAAHDMLDQLNDSDYGIILWVGEQDQVIEPEDIQVT